MCYSSSVDIMHIDYGVLCMHTATATATVLTAKFQESGIFTSNL